MKDISLYADMKTINGEEKMCLCMEDAEGLHVLAVFVDDVAVAKFNAMIMQLMGQLGEDGLSLISMR